MNSMPSAASTGSPGSPRCTPHAAPVRKQPLQLGLFLPGELAGAKQHGPPATLGPPVGGHGQLAQ